MPDALTFRRSIWPWSLTMSLYGALIYLVSEGRPALEVGGITGFALVMVTGLVFLTGRYGAGRAITQMVTLLAILITFSVVQSHGLTHWYISTMTAVVVGIFPVLITTDRRDIWIARDRLAATGPLADRLHLLIAAYANEQDDLSMIWRLTAIPRHILSAMAKSPISIIRDKEYFKGNAAAQEQLLEFARSHGANFDEVVINHILNATLALIRVDLETAEKSIQAVETATHKESQS